MPAAINGITRDTIFALAIPAVGAMVAGALLFALLFHLIAKIVETAMLSDPFVGENATRLNQIGVLLLGMEVLGWVTGWVMDPLLQRLPKGTHIESRLRFFAGRASGNSSGFCIGPGVPPRRRDARRAGRHGLRMAIIVKLDDLLYARRMTLTDLAGKVDITLANLSILKTGKAKAIRFSTLEAICAALDCQPGDIIAFDGKA